jgi:hypothetical protein
VCACVNFCERRSEKKTDKSDGRRLGGGLLAYCRSGLWLGVVYGIICHPQKMGSRVGGDTEVANHRSRIELGQKNICCCHITTRDRQGQGQEDSLTSAKDLRLGMAAATLGVVEAAVWGGAGWREGDTRRRPINFCDCRDRRVGRRDMCVGVCAFCVWVRERPRRRWTQAPLGLGPCGV